MKAPPIVCSLIAARIRTAISSAIILFAIRRSTCEANDARDHARDGLYNARDSFIIGTRGWKAQYPGIA